MTDIDFHEKKSSVSLPGVVVVPGDDDVLIPVDVVIVVLIATGWLLLPLPWLLDVDDELAGGDVGCTPICFMPATGYNSVHWQFNVSPTVLDLQYESCQDNVTGSCITHYSNKMQPSVPKLEQYFQLIKVRL